MNKDTLKKHHFWILVGVVPLLVLITAISFQSAGASHVTTRKAKIETSEKEAKELQQAAATSTTRNQEKSPPTQTGPDIMSLADIDAEKRQGNEYKRAEGDLARVNWLRQIGARGDLDKVNWLAQNSNDRTTWDPLRNSFPWPGDLDNPANKLRRFNYLKPFGTWTPDEFAQKGFTESRGELDALGSRGFAPDVIAWLKSQKSFKNAEELRAAMQEKFGAEKWEPLYKKLLASHSKIWLPMKFGDEIPNNTGVNERDLFTSKDVYIEEYERMARLVAPTQFGSANRWQAVLRHVNGIDNDTDVRGWSKKTPDPYLIWLALEDIWVQRGILVAVREANNRLGEFRRLRDDDGIEQGRVWQVFESRDLRAEFCVDTKTTGKPMLVARLTNLSDRLMPFGVDGYLTFTLTLSDSSGKPTKVTYKFGDRERYLTGRGGRKIRDYLVSPGPKPDRDNAKLVSRIEYDGSVCRMDFGGDEVLIEADANRKDFSRNDPKDRLTIFAPPPDIAELKSTTKVLEVRQEYDARTVPIQQIDKLVLGYPDSRTVKHEPKPHPNLKPIGPPKDPAGGETGGGTPTGGSSQPGMGTPPGMTPGTVGSPGGMELKQPGSGSSGTPPGTSGSGEQPGNSGGSAGYVKLSVGKWNTGYGGGSIQTVLIDNQKRYVSDPNGQVRRMPVAINIVVDQQNVQEVLVALANSPLRFQATQVDIRRFTGTLVPATSSGSSGFGVPPGTSGGSSFSPPPAGLYGGVTSGSGGVILNEGGSSSSGTSSNTTSGPPSEAQFASGLVELTVYGIVTLYEMHTPGGSEPTAQK